MYYFIFEAAIRAAALIEVLAKLADKARESAPES